MNDDYQPGRRLAVLTRDGDAWKRAGSAWVNRDGSINVYLDVLPLNGQLHLRPVDKVHELTAVPRKTKQPRLP